MADDDNFDIDIYGDDPSPEFQENNAQGGDLNMDTPTGDVKQDANMAGQGTTNGEIKSQADQSHDASKGNTESGQAKPESGTQQIASTGGSIGQVQPPKQAPVQQGLKRKQGADDDRPTDPGASAALLISELHWWTTEEDVRGWANQSGCEDEIVEITFSEHKVNGKSKGQVYVHMATPQAATALKHRLEAYYAETQPGKQPNVVFNPAHINPFRTLPKDVPARDKSRENRSSGNFGGRESGSQGNYNRGGGYGNRGGYNRGGNQMGFQNRNFSGPAGNMSMGGFGGANAMPGFGGGMNQFGNFNQRGNMMGGMRGNMGNRGGRGGNMMGGMAGMGAMGGNMPMGGMAGMGMNMGMGGMPANMGMMGMSGATAGFGAGAQPHFNPAFFGQTPAPGPEGNWNPHGAKRPRPE